MKNYDRYDQLVENWRKLVFPARPSPEEIVVFEKFLKNKKGKKLLILGATPEFRDLGSKHKLKVTCADINPNMLEGMKQLMKFKNEKEELVECNWLKMPFEDNSFDLIYAEQSANIIRTELFDAFFKESGRVLKKGGEFVIKMIVPSKENKKEVMKKFREENRDIHYLYDHLYHVEDEYKETTQIGHARLRPMFNKLLKEGKITKKEHAEFFGAWGSVIDADLKLNALDKKRTEAIIKKYFKVKNILFGEDFEKHKIHPIYILEK